MIWLLTSLFGCTPLPGSVINPTTTEWDKSIRCLDYHEPEHCYALRESKDSTLRSVALNEGCQNNYLDSCNLLYEHRLATGSPGRAFMAAETACRNGSADHCHIVLSFGERFPKLAEHADSRRAENQAALDAIEAGNPPREHRPNQR